MNRHNTNDSEPNRLEPERLCGPDACQLATTTHRALETLCRICSAFKQLRHPKKEHLDPAFRKLFPGRTRESIIDSLMRSISELDSIMFTEIKDAPLALIFGETAHAYLEVSNGPFEWLGNTFTSAHEAAWATTYNLLSDCLNARKDNYLSSPRFMDELLRDYSITHSEATRIQAVLRFEEHRATEKCLVLSVKKGESFSFHVAWSFQGGEKKSDTDPEQFQPKIPPRAQEAWNGYQFVIDSLECEKTTDANAYAMLYQAYTAEGRQRELPSEENWTRYLRDYRKRTGQQKNGPRGGRADGAHSVNRPSG